MPLKQVSITLSEPVMDHGGPVRAVKVRQPTLTEYAAAGDPFRYIPREDGNLAYIEIDTAIAQYMKCCVIEPSTPELLEQIALEDQIAIKEAILGFFFEARLAYSNKNSPSTSPSTNA